MGGAMSWVSERHLVAAISNAGGFGVIACGAMKPALLEAEIAGNPGADAQAVRRQPDHHASPARRAGAGLPAGQGRPYRVRRRDSAGPAIRAAKDGGAKVIAFAPALVLAKRFMRSGVDALVIEGTEAGGHIGPVSLTVLAQEILPHIRDVPVFVAGGIGRGEAILSYLEMGAAGAQLGTRFAASTESIAHANFKQAFVRASARDAVPSIQLDERFPVIPVRGLVNEGTKRFLAHQAGVVQKFQAGSSTRARHSWRSSISGPARCGAR